MFDHFIKKKFLIWIHPNILLSKMYSSGVKKEEQKRHKQTGPRCLDTFQVEIFSKDFTLITDVQYPHGLSFWEILRKYSSKFSVTDQKIDKNVDQKKFKLEIIGFSKIFL